MTHKQNAKEYLQTHYDYIDEVQAVRALREAGYYRVTEREVSEICNDLYGDD